MNDRITITVVACIMVTLSLSSCYSAMPIRDTQTGTESTGNGKIVIVYYDATIGTDAIEEFVKNSGIEVLYRYDNIKGYAMRLKSDKQRKALERTKGVLSVQDDQVMQLQGKYSR